MGKLYKIRRAVLKNPYDFMIKYRDGSYLTKGASVSRGREHRRIHGTKTKAGYWMDSHRNFIKSVLSKIMAG